MPSVPKPRKRSLKARMKKALLRQRRSLQRRARPKVRKVSKRFAARRNAEYAEWIRSLPCILTGRWRTINGIEIRHACCGHPVEAMHVKSRGAGGSDVGNLVPGDHLAHRIQHLDGIKSWAERWFGSLAELTRIAREVYPKQYELACSLGWSPEKP